MYKILMISIFFLTACSQQSYETVQIIGKNPDNTISVRGMGVWDNDILITSAHVVRHSGISYSAQGRELRIAYIDSLRDRAFLTLKNDTPQSGIPYEFSRTSSGEIVSTQVIRNNHIVTLTGRILESSGSVLGYDPNGGIMQIQGIVLTDIPFVPGDSGAPIYNSSHELIDLVHVQ